jgi:hypothetical protein
MQYNNLILGSNNEDRDASSGSNEQFVRLTITITITITIRYENNIGIVMDFHNCMSIFFELNAYDAHSVNLRMKINICPF